MLSPLPHRAAVVDDLRIDGRPTPALGVDTETPRLAWRLQGSANATTSVVVEAAATQTDLEARQSLMLSVTQPLTENAYRVPAGILSEDMTIFWRVGVIMSGDGEPRWSNAAIFETAPWQALLAGSWITSPEWADPDPAFAGPPPVFGRDFAIDGLVRRARLALSAPGTVEVRVNGANPNDEVLGFGYSVERVRVPARVLDVTDILTTGSNSIRITIAGGISWVPEPADGRYTKLTTSALPPRLLARLCVEYTDGRTVEVVSDSDWRFTYGPVRYSHWYGGEDVDGRIPEPDAPVNRDWNDVHVLGPSSLHPLWWAKRPPMRVVERIPGRLLSTHEGTSIIDFGVNVAGWPVIDLTGARAGQRIVVRPAELLDGSDIDQRTVGTPIWDSYMARDGDQIWHPRHVYHGFRYISISGAEPGQLAAQAAVIRTDNTSVGELATDDMFLQTLHRIIDRAVQSNMYSVFTDCPSREKLGWIEQLNLCFGLLSRTYDVEAHLRDSLDLMRDAQHATGLVPSIVPQTTDFSGNPWAGDPDAFVDDVNWGGAIAHLAWQHYREYGDIRVLEENRDAILRYLGHVEGRSDGDLLDYGLGDWVAIDESTPSSMVATAGWIRLLRTAADILFTLGDTGGADDIVTRSHRVEARFTAAFSDANSWGSGSQASLALALDLGVVSPPHRDDVFAQLLQTIDAADGHLTVGENSWPELVRVLHNFGRDDVIDNMIRLDDGPGYGLQIRLGATALAETWRGASGARYENSQNHFMLGMIHDWIAIATIGLGQPTTSLAWQHAVMRPNTSLHASRAGMRQITTRGEFSLSWDASNKSVQVRVPEGAHAELHLPEGWADVKSDDGAPIIVQAGSWEWTS